MVHSSLPYLQANAVNFCLPKGVAMDNSAKCRDIELSVSELGNAVTSLDEDRCHAEEDILDDPIPCFPLLWLWD